MNNFFQWFLVKHIFVSAILFPELSFVWAVWMRNEVMVICTASWLAYVMFMRLGVFFASFMTAFTSGGNCGCPGNQDD